MKLLVTGGSGFIGKAFVKAYRGVFDITAPTHSQMNLSDVRAIDKYFKAHRPDAVVHLAGVAEKATGAALEADDLIMFKNIQYMSIVYGVKKLVIIGSGAEFDRSRPISNISESAIGELVPTDGYGLGKYLIHALAHKDKITTELRIFDVFGAGGKGVIDKIVAAGAKRKKQITLARDRVVSAIYIDDAVKVIGEVIKRDIPKGDYNLVAAEPVSYLDIAKSVKRAVRKEGGDIEIVVKKDGQDLEYTASNAKLCSALPVKLSAVSASVKKLYEQIKYK